MDLHNIYNLCIFVTVLIFSAVCSVQDIKSRKVSDFLIWIGSGVCICVHLIFNLKTCWIFLISGVIFGAFYFIARQISGKKLGMADVYFGILQGLCLEPKMLPFCVLIEVALVFLILLVLLIWKKAAKKSDENPQKKRIPFIPFMSLGLLISFLVSVSGFMSLSG